MYTNIRMRGEGMIITRVEKHIINKNDKLFNIIDSYSFKSKNLYNYANYYIRQTFIITSKLSDGLELNEEQIEFLNFINSKVNEFNIKKQNNLQKKKDKALIEIQNKSLSNKDSNKHSEIIQKEYKSFGYFNESHKYLGYSFLEFLCSSGDDYKSMIAPTSQQILKLLDKSWVSFFESIKDWSKNPSKYLGRPKMPKYKHKTKGRFNIVFTNQNAVYKNGYIQLPTCFDKYNLLTKIDGKLQQVRIKPLGKCYQLEVVYNKEITLNKKESENIISIDLGVNNFATITNNIGLQPVVINGRNIKSINQYYNKFKAKIVSDLKKRHNKDWSNKLDKLNTQRNNKINDYMHKASKYIIEYCIKNNMDTIVIGKSSNWKKGSRLGKRVNQNFVQIPLNSFIEKLKYKSDDYGINLIITEESYTSGTSFLDKEEPVKDNYNKNRRIFRGLFKSNEGRLINADCNGAYQIMKKVFPKTLVDGIEDVGLHPIRVNIT